MLAKFFSLILTIYINHQIINAQRGGPVDCQKVQSIPKLDVSDFLGTWYILAIYPDSTLLSMRCPVVIFTWPAVGANNAQISVFKKYISFGNEKRVMGSASAVGRGTLGINFPVLPRDNGVYNVLGTDYENYAVLFTCNNYPGYIVGQNVWVMSRNKTLESQYWQNVFSTMINNTLPPNFLKLIDQNCNDQFPFVNSGK
ncbi:hypothetical protein ACKWTF_001299 [Chironomus riparius]